MRALALAALALCSACTSPCSAVADRVCARAGAADPVCRGVRAVAERPTVADEQTCRAAGVYLDELERR